jgi:hypothetical protein
VDTPCPARAGFPEIDSWHTGPARLLIVDESDPSSGAPTTFSTTLRTALTNFKPNVAVFGETLDLTRFSDPKQKTILRTYIQQKYSDVRFGVILAVSASSFDLLRSWRSELWPDVPIVFAAIDEATAAELKPDADTTGLIMRRTIKAMMAAARLLVPDLQGVAVLGGSLSRDAYRFQYLRELPILCNCQGGEPTDSGRCGIIGRTVRQVGSRLTMSPTVKR